MADQKPRRNTLQRQVILEELCKNHSHPTAAQLYERVRQRLPKISLGTVYRNLELLSQTGTIQKLEFSGAEARFDGVIEHHYHVRCTDCGRLDDVQKSPVIPADASIQTAKGYQILGHRLEYVGICPQCRGGNDG